MGLNVAPINAARYGRLCADVVPKIIASDAEFDRLAAKLEELTFKKNSSREEKALAELLAKLVQDYDDAHHSLPALPPHKMISFLMKQRQLRQADLVPIFGSRSVASNVISGKREPSKAHIRRLARFFDVSPELFI